MTVAAAIRWIAWLWGTSSLFFISILLVGSVVEGGFRLGDLGDVIGFLAFPISPIVGFGIALWREGLGGAIVILGLVAQFALQPASMTNLWFLLGIALPGVLYLSYWMLTCRSVNDLSS